MLQFLATEEGGALLHLSIRCRSVPTAQEAKQCHAKEDPCNRGAMQQRSHATQEPCNTGAMQQRSHATEEPCSSGAMQQRSHATEELPDVKAILRQQTPSRSPDTVEEPWVVS